MKKKKLTIRDLIQENHPDTELLFMTEPEFDKAIVGVAGGIGIQHNPKVVYDYDKVIKTNVKMGMTYEDAVEYFDYNQAGAYVGDHTPIFIKQYKI